MNSNQQGIPNSKRRTRIGQWIAVGTAVCVLSACSNSMYIVNRNGSSKRVRRWKCASARQCKPVWVWW